MKQHKSMIIINNKINSILQNMPANTSKRGWTSQEDQIILQMASTCSQDKPKWVTISKELFDKTGQQRTGKQCRERWQNQLNPTIIREEWTQFQVITLFEMHQKFGNKWAKIAANLPGRTDNSVKNFFYSSVRRVLAKISMYLAKQRHRKEFKTVRQFESEYISKLMSVVDGHYEKRLRLTSPETFNLAKDVLRQISYLIIHGIDQNIEGIDKKLDQKILMMHEFRKNCKKRKKNHNFYNKEGQELQSLEAYSSPKEQQLQSSQSSSQKKKGNQAINIKQQRSIYKSFIMDLQSQQINKQVISLQVQYSKEQVWNIQGEDYNFNNKYLKMQQSHFEQKYKEQQDIFSMPFGYREESLGASRNFDQPEVVTNFKMLEVSMALDQCLLKAKQSQSFENIIKPKSDL